MNIKLTTTPFQFRYGAVGRQTEDGTYAVECPKCGWSKTAATNNGAMQDGRSHLCPRKVRISKPATP